MEELWLFFPFFFKNIHTVFINVADVNDDGPIFYIIYKFAIGWSIILALYGTKVESYWTGTDSN